MKLGREVARADSVFAALADRLLFGTAAPGARLESRTGTASLPARQAFAHGQAAIERWDLAVADSAFAAAARYDPAYAQAFLWLAQTRSWMTPTRPWRNSPIATWQSASERAAAGRARLSSRDQVLSDALLALARGDVDRACRVWTQLTILDPYDFASWYGLGNCLSRDDVVQRDLSSPSGWRFRSGYEQAMQAYRRAFQLLPSIHTSLRGTSFESVRRLLRTNSGALRQGQAVARDTMRFAAFPSLQGDTVAFVPWPIGELARSQTTPQATALAVRRERQLFHQIATGWVTAFPHSADALEALAISLEMLGDPGALDTMRRARAFATTPDARVRIAVAEVWMRVRFSIPSDLANVRAALALADSVLEEFPRVDAPEPLLLTSLATLTGRARLAAAYSAQPEAAAEWGVPGPLARSALPLLTLAALGGPAESLRVLEQSVDSAIDHALAPPLRSSVRLEWLARAATLAFPDYRFRSLAKLTGAGDYLLDAEAAFARGDTTAVRQMFSELQVARQLRPPADLALDALYPEAWLRAGIGDDRGAIAWLDPTLAALSATDPETFADPTRAPSLVRSLALRAELADRTGDRVSAVRWAAVVVALWSNADPFLQPLVLRMRRLAGVI